MRPGKKFLLLLWGLLPLLFLQILSSGCTKDLSEPSKSGTNDSTGSSPCDTVATSFSQDIEPIFSSNCATSGCHTSSSTAGGIVLETHSQIKDETKNGNVLCAIRHESGCSNMPNGQPQLSAEKIERIECWAEEGYSND